MAQGTQPADQVKGLLQGGMQGQMSKVTVAAPQTYCMIPCHKHAQHFSTPPQADTALQTSIHTRATRPFILTALRAGAEAADHGWLCS